MVTRAAALDRLGTESAFQVLARANALVAEGRSIINLGIGQPDFRTPDHVVEAACKALRDGHHGYTPAKGIPELRTAVAEDVTARTGAAVDPEHVLVVPGGKVTMFFAITMFGEPSAEIVYPDPGFPIYESLVRYSGARPRPLALRERDGFAVTADALAETITPDTRLVILNTPGNPTGGVIPRAEMDRIAEVLARNPQTAVLADEIYGRLIYDGQEHVSLLSYPDLRDQVILLDGWSKTHAMTGWRLGFGVWPKALVADAERLAVNSHSCVNAAAQHAGLAALTGSQDHVAEMHAAFDARRRALVDRLNQIDGITCPNPGGAFYAFPNITGTGYAAKELETALLEDAGVATVAGTSFGAAGEGYLRLSYANTKENVLAAAARIDAWLNGARD
ncbi:pyridoxal phosphate-dependent aminotransferase [Rhodovibrio salinarum]|uniref:aspartate transaminase n=1 Tax=Rhodovibrio salinarum TaxID=1087 RepID=A0A934QJM0_9PROT|nr:pyridoxal phosphate-dependent aminotransferase [Rhodovibrio salinarum]MBK1697650.1 pyridoxal phosphate-dependent aminotransferase [Rhodovibrio salinarum]